MITTTPTRRATMSTSASPTASILDGRPHEKEHATKKPFFIMDWLEEITDHDAERIREIIHTPPPPSRKDYVVQTPKTSHCTPKRARLQSLNGPVAQSEPNLFRMGRTLDDADRAGIRKTLFHSVTAVAAGTAETSNEKSSEGPSSSFFGRSVAMANTWNDKGLKKAKEGMWVDAFVCWDNALQIRLQLFEPCHLDIANSYNNRGIALGKLGQRGRAIRSLEKALEIRTEILGQCHMQVAATLHNLANVHHQAGDHKKALNLFLQSKTVQEQSDENQKNKHSQLARSCSAIGHLYYEVQQFEDAHLAYLDALHNYRKAGLSDSDRQVVGIQADLADLEASSRLQRRQEAQSSRFQGIAQRAI